MISDDKGEHWRREIHFVRRICSKAGLAERAFLSQFRRSGEVYLLQPQEYYYCGIEKGCEFLKRPIFLPCYK